MILTLTRVKFPAGGTSPRLQNLRQFGFFSSVSLRVINQAKTVALMETHRKPAPQKTVRVLDTSIRSN